MQLFITNNYKIQHDIIEIYDQRIIHQCSKVLRYYPGEVICIQDNLTRYECEIMHRSNGRFPCKIIKTSQHTILKTTFKRLIVAMTNKRDKIELIAQKVAEIGIDELCIWKAKRSIISDFSDHKLERVRNIIYEASEQSRNRSSPKLTIYQKITDLPEKAYFCYQDSSNITTGKLKSQEKEISIIIGPEGGFDPSELDYFSEQKYSSLQLGESILRTETAAIIAAWVI